MKVLVRKTSLRLLFQRILRWAQRGLFAAAILMLGYCGFVVADTWMFQHRESENFERLLHDRGQARSGGLQTASATSPESAAMGNALKNAPGGLIGRIEIPSVGISVMVAEGTRNSILRRAAGHIIGTALPGQPGNVGISGHRDTFFRPLRNIQRDDIITLTTLGGEYRYRVVSMKVVSPDNVAVLNRDENEILTLVTCYPFYFVGSAPRRFIVRAERVT